MMRSNPTKSLKSFITILFLALFVVGCGGAVVPRTMAASPTIRVLILGAQESIFIKGTKQYPKLSLVFDEEAEGFKVNDKPANLPLILTPSKKFIEINGKKYRGRVELHPAKKGVLVINELPLELYLVGLINGEISSKWPIEAIKTQSVIARTYALYQKEKRKNELYHLKSTTADQVYIGADKEDKAAYKAVKSTYGEVVIYKGDLALTVYHSSAGGRTENSEDVWSERFPYLRSVNSKYDAVAPNYEWRYEIPRWTFREKLAKGGFTIGEIKKVKISKRTRSKRVAELIIYDKDRKKHKLKGEDIRRTIGYSLIKSTKFKVKYRKKKFIFYGSGSGHGVGLSQWGAKGMADAGYKYNKILRHYYKGTKIKKLY